MNSFQALTLVDSIVKSICHIERAEKCTRVVIYVGANQYEALTFMTMYNFAHSFKELQSELEGNPVVRVCKQDYLDINPLSLAKYNEITNAK